MTTVICLDDFHSNDRAGRKVSGKSHHIPTGGVDKRGKAGRGGTGRGDAAGCEDASAGCREHGVVTDHAADLSSFL